jgi:hypothetical protein
MGSGSSGRGRREQNQGWEVERVERRREQRTRAPRPAASETEPPRTDAEGGSAT